MEGDIVFEKRWKNSRGENDGWFFQVAGDGIHWSYHALFDAYNNEYSDGSAEFSFSGFERALAEFRECGGASLNEGKGSLCLSKEGDHGHIGIIPDGWGTGWNGPITAEELATLLNWHR